MAGITSLGNAKHRAVKNLATGGKATKATAPAFRGYESLDALTNLSKNGGTAFWMTDPKTGKLNSALQAQVDQQKAAAASYVPKDGDMRYGFVRFGQGMDPEKDNRSWQEKFSTTKGAGLWAMGINPDDPRAEEIAQKTLKSILNNPKYTDGVWGSKEWGRDDAKMPSVRQIMAQNPNIPATELLDYAKRMPQAQNALQPRDIGGMVLDTFAEIALTVLSGGNPTLAVMYGAAKGGSDTGSWLGAGLARLALPANAQCLRWDGQVWSLVLRAPDGGVGAEMAVERLAVAIDLGSWLLLRAYAVAGGSRWQVARASCVGAAWHGLRVALKAHAGSAQSSPDDRLQP